MIISLQLNHIYQSKGNIRIKFQPQRDCCPLIFISANAPMTVSVANLALVAIFN